jgi:hypothetical protein
VPDRDVQKNVYLLDLADKAKPLTLFLSDISSFDVSPNGIAVYSKDYGISGYGEKVVIDRNAYVSINLIDEHGKEKNIKKIYFYPRPSGVGAGRLWEQPIITKDGITIAFIVKASADKYKLNILTIK